jgi:hypothetical protein
MGSGTPITYKEIIDILVNSNIQNLTEALQEELAENVKPA